MASIPKRQIAAEVRRALASQQTLHAALAGDPNPCLLRQRDQCAGAINALQAVLHACSGAGLVLLRTF